MPCFERLPKGECALPQPSAPVAWPVPRSLAGLAPWVDQPPGEVEWMSRCDLDPAPQIINKETREFPGLGSRNHLQTTSKSRSTFEVNVPTFFVAGALWCLPKCGFKGGHTKTHHRFTNRDVQWWKISKILHVEHQPMAQTSHPDERQVKHTFPSPSWIFRALASLGFCRCFWRSKRAFSRRLHWHQGFKIIQIHLPSQRVFCGRISEFLLEKDLRFF